MELTTPSLICFHCCVAAGLAVVSTQTRTTTDGVDSVVENIVHPRENATDSELAAIAAFVASPPAEHNHAPPPSIELVQASQRWLDLQTQLAAIPTVPVSGSDPYAAIRGRLAGQVATALATAQSLGGPI